jgi:tRNA-dihydrouridine synthase A
MAEQLARGTGLHAMTRHMLGLFNGQPGARAWRRVLSERAPKPGAGLDVLDAAIEAITQHTVDAASA